MIDLTGARWHKSSYSGGANSECVEVAGERGELGGWVAIRDTKNRSALSLALPASAWRTFLSGLKSSEFDRA
ncbi:DUF397 domain-containing protein [Cryptosporangium phraense]|uniref:DUF397 domain-containing protein n=1 Tax=Cryptosporangium phraense TaxID=2593070 RepID=A0A545AEF2_9ACTN|nr:DUF397 domain-containing protein [Cryptosporangium phraense]TQS39704.1 DUF397 domain-containing protein [Cryptosporangium phraense]